MSPVPFSEALAATSPKVLAWRITPPEPGQRTLSMFSLESGGAVQVAWRRHPEADVQKVTTELIENGHRVGKYDDFCDFVWLVEPQGVTVWGEDELSLVAKEQQIQLGDGQTLARDAIDAVIGYADEDYLGRGLRARLTDGQIVDLVLERSWSALADPTYSRNELLFETSWVGEIGSVIATWAGCSWEDRI